MIALGIVPGLASMGYCVVDVSLPIVNPLDCDVLLGSKLKNSTATLLKKAAVHRLVLDIVLERTPPAILALGPPLNTKEPPEHIEAVRYMLRMVARTINIPVVEMDMQLICQTLGLDERSLARKVRKQLQHPLGSRDRRLLIATAVAIAGVVSVAPLAARSA